MGLIEKRLIKQGKEEWIPTANQELRELTGGEQVYDVDWDTFSSDAEGLQNLQGQGFRRINAAIRVICRDDLGKEAMAESVKKILLRDVDDPAQKEITVKDGVITIQCAWGKGGDGYYEDGEIRRIIERAL